MSGPVAGYRGLQRGGAAWGFAGDGARANMPVAQSLFKAIDSEVADERSKESAPEAGQAVGYTQQALAADVQAAVKAAGDVLAPRRKLRSLVKPHSCASNSRKRSFWINRQPMSAEAQELPRPSARRARRIA